MNRYYISKNTIMKYWLIEINSTLDGDDGKFVFKGKTIQGALKSAQKYCDESNSKIKYRTLSVGNVIRECDFWGR